MQGHDDSIFRSFQSWIVQTVLVTIHTEADSVPLPPALLLRSAVEGFFPIPYDESIPRRFRTHISELCGSGNRPNATPCDCPCMRFGLETFGAATPLCRRFRTTTSVGPDTSACPLASSWFALVSLLPSRSLGSCWLSTDFVF